MECKECGSNLEVITTTVEAVPSKVGSSKQNKKIIISVLLIGVLIFVGMGFKGIIMALTSNSVDLIFFKDFDDNIYAKSSNQEEYILKASNINEILVTKDGKKMYTIDADENLYVRENKQRAKKIASDVRWAATSPSGNTVVFLERSMYSPRLGTLYVKSGNKDPEKVSSENCDPNTVNISENGEYVVFSELYLDEDYDIKYVLYSVSGEKVKGKEHSALGVNNKGTVLTQDSDGDLYLTKKDKDSEKIGSEVYSVIANTDFSNLIVLDVSGNLYTWTSKGKEKIDSNVARIEDVKGRIWLDYGMYPKKIVYANIKELDIIYLKNDNMYIKLHGKKPERITNNSISTFKISDDFRNVAYVDDGELYVKRFVNNKLKTEEKIDTFVSEIDMNIDGAHIAYIKDDALYYLSKNKKQRIKIEEEVRIFDMKENGDIYYETMDDSLFLTKGETTSKKITDDVYEWVVNDKTVYFMDYDDVLFEVIESQSPKEIKEDIYDLVAPEKNRYSITVY